MEPVCFPTMLAGVGLVNPYEPEKTHQSDVIISCSGGKFSLCCYDQNRNRSSWTEHHQPTPAIPLGPPSVTAYKTLYLRWEGKHHGYHHHHHHNNNSNNDNNSKRILLYFQTSHWKEIWDFVISYGTANCLQHVRSKGQGAILCWSHANTSGAYHVQHIVC